MDDELGRAWRDHRRHVLDIAFRMLGTVAEAEDAVQEAFARLVRADLDRIDDVGGWLVVVVSRVCLDRLRAGQRHPTSPEADLAARSADGAVDADVGGRIGTRTVVGAGPVAAGLLQFFGPDSGTTLLSVPATGRAGDAGFVALRHGRVMAVATLTVRAGRVAHIDSLADPTRLGSLSAVLGL